MVYNKSENKKGKNNMARFVYADNAATTPVAPEVIAEMTPIFEVSWGNPSSLHQKGREAKALLDEAKINPSKYSFRYPISTPHFSDTL